MAKLNRLANFAEAQKLYSLIYSMGNVEHPTKGWLGPYGGHTQRDAIILQHVEKVFGEDTNQTILDASCGRGHLLVELIHRGYKAEGTEIAPCLLMGDLKNLPVRILGYHQLLKTFGPEVFDMVISSDVLEHLLSERDVYKALKNLVGISKKHVLISVGIVPAKNFPTALPREVGSFASDLHHVLKPWKWWTKLISSHIQIDWTNHNRRVLYCFGVKLGSGEESCRS